MKRVCSLLAVIIFAVALGCNGAVSPRERAEIMNGAYAYKSPIADSLWQVMESCSGLSGSSSAVRFMVQPDGIFVGGEPRAGAWLDENIIVLSPPYKDDWFTLKHEEMHALLKGGPSHPPKYFNGVCGNLMGPLAS